MFKIDYNITIDGKRLQMLDSVEIKTSVETLLDTATIKLPSTIFNKNIAEVESIKKNQSVVIMLGYDGNLIQEFSGYISYVERSESGLLIECENEIYLFNNTQLDNKVFDNPSVQDIINYVLQQCAPGLKLNCIFDFKFDKYTIQNATGLDVLKNVREECGCYIYIKDNFLNITMPYIQTKDYKEIKYNPTINIIAEGYSLKYKDKDDRKLKVIAKGKNKDGKEITEEGGEPGGDTMTINYKGIATSEILKSNVENALAQKSYSGYEGSFKTWHQPFAKKGDTAIMIDPSETERNGKYFITAVTTTCNSGGITRQVFLGKALSS